MRSEEVIIQEPEVNQVYVLPEGIGYAYFSSSSSLDFNLTTTAISQGWLTLTEVLVWDWVPLSKVQYVLQDYILYQALT